MQSRANCPISFHKIFLESEGLTLRELNLATDGDEWSGLGPACFTLMEKSCDTHWLFLQDNFIILSSHLCLCILGFTGQNSICFFYSLCVCLLFHPLHPPGHHPDTSMRLYGSMTMLMGGNQGYGMYTSFHENQHVIHYLLMDLSLTHLQLWQYESQFL